MKETEEQRTKKLTKRGLPEEVRISVKAGLAKKGEGVLVLDMREVSSFTDYFIIMNGNSTRQNVALYENIEHDLRKVSVRPHSIEGREHGEWILLDYGHFIVHVFSKQTRDYYSLEKLWGDAPKLEYQ
jgi:ribosome-associated protein